MPKQQHPAGATANTAVASPPGPPTGVLQAPRTRSLSHTAIIALAISLTAHLLFLALAGAWHINGGGNGSSGGPAASGPIEMAVVTETELTGALEGAPLDAGIPGVDEPIVNPLAPGVDLDQAPGGSGLPDAGELGSVGTGSGGAGTGDGIGIGTGSGGAGGGGAKFFGVEAGGNRFIYIVDISGSMQGPKLATLKKELSQSIETLNPNSQFMIWFFESVPHALGNSRWVEATPSNKEKAIGTINEQEAQGGTMPEPAFVPAFALKPRADAIYFMTDGIFDPAVTDAVFRLNKQGTKIPIHCIAFGEKGSETMLRKIAKESGGTYTYVEGPKLK